MSDASFASDLSAQMAWTHALARQLVRDDAEAEDVAQETLLRVLASPPREAGALRGFLRRVLLNVRNERLRAEARREARERDTARDARESGTDELVQRLQWQRRLVDAVERLNEPFRGTILMRFLDQLPPREIAARTGVPVRTVNSRLQRGLEQLRADLDRAEGGRRTWALALRGWLRASSERAPVGVPLVPVALGAAALVALVAAAAWWLGPRSSRAGTAASVAELAPERGAGEIDAPPAAGQREPLASAGQRAARIVGRVLAPDGTPVAGARVELVQAPLAGFDLVIDERERDEARLIETFTAPDGSFALEAREGTSLRLRAIADGLGPEQLDDVHAGDAVELVLAPAGRLAISASRADEPCAGAAIELLRQGVAAPVWNGTTGADGRVEAAGLTRGIYTVQCTPLDGTRTFTLDVALPAGGEAAVDFRIRAGRELSGTVRDARGRPLSTERDGVRISGSRTAAVAADANGAFRLRGLPVDFPEWTVAVSARGYAPLERRIRAAEAPPELTLELEPELRLAGTVVDTAGRPVRGAWVACGSRLTSTDELGRFELDGLAPGSAEVVLVHAAGHAANAAPSRGPTTESRRELGRIVLGPAASVVGRTRTSTGRAVGGASVELQRLSPESPADPALEDDEAEVTIVATPSTPALDSSAERELAGKLERAERRRARSNLAGTFRVDDLAPGRYRVFARANGYEPTSPLELELPPAGLVQDVELVFEEGRSLSGLVRGSDGAPLANAWLIVHAPELDGGGPVQLSGLDGRFTLRGVPAGPVELEASAHQTDAQGEYLYLKEALTDLVAPRDDLEIVLPRNLPIEGRVLDERGQPLAGYLVCSADEHGRRLCVRTDAQGRFRVGAAEGVRVELELGAPSGRDSAEAAEARARPRYDARMSGVAAGSREVELHAVRRP